MQPLELPQPKSALAEGHQTDKKCKKIIAKISLFHMLKLNISHVNLIFIHLPSKENTS